MLAQELLELGAGELRIEPAPVEVEAMIGPRQQPGRMRDACARERLLQPLGLLERHDAIAPAQKRDRRRRLRADMTDRRERLVAVGILRRSAADVGGEALARVIEAAAGAIAQRQ